jgi:tetratricopeptide (TPR) repeat protein
VLPKLAGFVAHWMGEWDGTAAMMQRLLERIAAELAQVRAAWSWAVEQGDASVIGRMARPISNFFEQQGLWAEGMAALEGAVRALRRADRPDLRALGDVLRGLAALQYHRGAAEEMEASANEMIEIARALDARPLMRYAINMSANSLQQRGRYEEARARFAEGLERALKESSAPHIALFTANIANSDAYVGRYEAALAGHERALALYREQVNDYTAAIELVSIGDLHRVLGRPAQAIERLNEALVSCLQHGFRSIQCLVSLNLGLACDEAGEAASSARWLAAALREARQHGEPRVEIQALLASTRLDCDAGDTAAARAKVWEALTLAERTRSAALQAHCAAAFGEILIHEGRSEDGVALVRWTTEQAQGRPAEPRPARAPPRGAAGAPPRGGDRPTRAGRRTRRSPPCSRSPPHRAAEPRTGVGAPAGRETATKTPPS